MRCLNSLFIQFFHLAVFNCLTPVHALKFPVTSIFQIFFHQDLKIDLVAPYVLWLFNVLMQ
jgi:hypothetical protein